MTTTPDPLLGFEESATAYGLVLHFPPLDGETLDDLGDDMLDLAADLAESTGRPVDVFLADVGVRAHRDPEVERLSVVLRVDHDPRPAWIPGVHWQGAIARGLLTPAVRGVGVAHYCGHMNGHRSDRTALACATKLARAGGRLRWGGPS